MFFKAKAEINETTNPVERELLVTSEMANDSNCYKIKRIKRGNENELSKRNGKRNK